MAGHVVVVADLIVGAGIGAGDGQLQAVHQVLLHGGEGLIEVQSGGGSTDGLEGGHEHLHAGNADLHTLQVCGGADRLLGQDVAEATLAPGQDLVAQRVIQAVGDFLHDVAIQEVPGSLVVFEDEGQLHHQRGPVQVAVGAVGDDAHLMGAQVKASQHVGLAAQLGVAADLKGHGTVGGRGHLLGEQGGQLVVLVVIGGGVHMGDLDRHSGEALAVAAAIVGVGLVAAGGQHAQQHDQRHRQGRQTLRVQFFHGFFLLILCFVILSRFTCRDTPSTRWRSTYGPASSSSSIQGSHRCSPATAYRCAPGSCARSCRAGRCSWRYTRR